MLKADNIYSKSYVFTSSWLVRNSLTAETSINYSVPHDGAEINVVIVAIIVFPLLRGYSKLYTWAILCLKGWPLMRGIFSTIDHNALVWEVVIWKESSSSIEMVWQERFLSWGISIAVNLRNKGTEMRVDLSKGYCCMKQQNNIVVSCWNRVHCIGILDVISVTALCQPDLVCSSVADFAHWL